MISNLPIVRDVPFRIKLLTGTLTILTMYYNAAQAATVNYTTQTGVAAQTVQDNNSPPYAGFYNSTATVMGLYANSGSGGFGSNPQAVGYYKFTTDGGQASTAQALRVGQQVSVTLSLSGAQSGITGNSVGFCLNNGTTFTDVTKYNNNGRVEYSFTGGDSSAAIYDNGGKQTVNLPGFTTFAGGLTYTITLVSKDEYNFQVSGGGATYNINKLGFTAGTTIDSLSIFNRGYNNRDALFSAISVTDVQPTYTANSGETKTVSGVITDNGAIVNNPIKLGFGTVIFASSNTFSGTITNSQGILRLAHNSAAGTGSKTLVATTRTNAFEVDGGVSIPSTIAFKLSNDGTGGANTVPYALRSVTGSNNIAGPIIMTSGGGATIVTVNSGSTLNLSGTITNDQARTLNLQGSGTGIVSGVIADAAGATTVQVNSTGSWALSGNNTYTGGTTLTAGTLNINSATALGATASAFTISGGTIDNTSGSAKTLSNNNPQSWNSDFTFTGSSDLNVGSGAVTPNASRQITVSGGNLAVGGVIGGGAISLTKVGNGTLTLSGANTFSGGLLIKAGTVSGTTSSSALGGSGTGSVTLGDSTGSASATLLIDGRTFANPVTVQSATSGTLTMGNSGGASAVFSGGVTLNQSMTVDAGSSGGTINFTTGGITGAGGVTVNFTGSGYVQLSQGSSANTYAGNTTITQGKLRLNSATAIPNGTGKGVMTLNPTSPNTATFDLNGQNQTINGLTSSGTGTAIVDNSSASAKVLTIGTSGSNPDGIFTGTIQNSGSSTSLAVTKAGSGKLTLTGKSTYGGATTISGGTLLVNGGSTSDSSSGTGSGAVSVSSVATLGGTGRIGGNVTFSSGALALFTNGATLVIGGTLTLNANVVHLTIPANLAAGTYTLATYTASGSSGSFNSTPVVDSGSFAAGTTNFITTSGGTVNLVVQNVTATALTRTTGNSPSTYGDALTFHAAISPDPGVGATISFRTNGVQFGTANTISGGTADLSTSALPYSGGAAYAVTAVFAGSGNFTASSGTLSGGQQVDARPVSLSGTRAYDGTTNAAAAILSVGNAVGADTVNVASGTGGLADKNVGTQSIASFGTLALGNNAAGNYTLAGATGSVVITQAVTAVSASSSANPSGYKDSISFTAALPTDATGNVVFKTNAIAFSTNALSTGTATSASTIALPRGTNIVTVEYAGDSNYLGSTNNLTGGQIVTNHPPSAATMFVQRSAGLTLKIALADVVTNWNDVDADSVALDSLNLVTTNNVNLTTNSTWILYTNSPNVDDQISYTVSDGQGGTATGLINVVIVATVTGTNSISSITNNGSSVSLLAYGIPDLTYVTQRSTNLADWVSIATNVAATNGAISVTDNFIDLGAPPASAYYRLSWSP